MPKVALVTGAAVRLGRAIAMGLGEDGFDVAVHYGSSGEAAASAVEELGAKGRRAVALQADLASTEGALALARAVEEGFGRLDLLVNSASTYLEGRLEDVSAEEWDQVMSVNVRSPFLLTRELSPMLRRNGGAVVNLVDLSAFRPWIRYPHHSVSKAALLQLTRAQARALAPDVRVNAIAPGNVLPPEEDGPEVIEASRKRIPLGRIGDPEDIVGAVRYLAGAPYVTGEVLVVDGGRMLNP